MLVLSRQRDQTIMIGDNIEITIVDIQSDRVRLGIAAPRKIPVHRKEIFDVVRCENTDACNVQVTDLQIAEKNLRAQRKH